jgi:hypothetical protein
MGILLYVKFLVELRVRGVALQQPLQGIGWRQRAGAGLGFETAHRQECLCYCLAAERLEICYTG